VLSNAGISKGSVGAEGLQLSDWSEDAFDRMIDVNLKSVWLCMRDEIKAKLRHGHGGAIVNMASISGLIALPTAGAYCAAKHGVLGLTKIAAVEYASRGIRENADCPGFIVTDLARGSSERIGDELTQKIPAGGVGTVQDVAEMVVWLCSNRSSYVTGQAIAVDGGYVAQ
jgi:NAD(P)-dependent dehydrogenase (short-subunit alcohol dehydrogenase family)